METTQILAQIQEDYGNRLILTGLAALQYPAVVTKQLTFFNPTGDKEDYFIGAHHVFIRRFPKKKINTQDHLLFIARHIDLYAKELDLILNLLPDISLPDFKDHDQAWRIFAYLKKHLLKESVTLKKSIGRRYIDLGDTKSPRTITDSSLHIRDALLVPNYLHKTLWLPKISNPPNREEGEKTFEASRAYFSRRKLRPLFHRFSRYASRLESSASAKIEGYDASIAPESLKIKVQKRLKSHPALRANLNLDNLHRNLPDLAKESLSLEFLKTIQQAIVKDTWQNESEKIDKTPGEFRPFDEVIVNRGGMDEDNVVFIAPKAKDVTPLLEELIDFYYQSRASFHPLDLAALFKCQLVIIHPFGDGNGRLARWSFFYILVKEGLLDSVHQAPISHIFLEEKNRYYQEIANVDRSVMTQASYTIDSKTRRYHAHYPSADIYRSLDYSTWLSYTYDAFTRALNFSMEEHAVFEKGQAIFQSFQKKVGTEFFPNQQHEIIRAIDIGLKKQWGKKTEKRLENNGINQEHVKILRDLIF
jgi:Fic family protein